MTIFFFKLIKLNNFKTNYFHCIKHENMKFELKKKKML
jgi:hypothetical protein